MASDLKLCAPSLNLCFQRGDTVRWTFAVKTAAGAVVDITGCSFKLTVDPSSEPDSATNNLFQLTGTITDAPNGIVRFGMSALQANQTPGTYFYDLEMTDSGNLIRTIAKGEFVIEQDITK